MKGQKQTETLKNPAPQQDKNALTILAKTAQKQDPDRFLCAMMASSEKREGLFALINFYHDIAKIKDTVSESMLGYIRFQWWRDALDALAAGEDRAYDTLSGLAILRNDGHLPLKLLSSMIDAREKQLEDKQFQTVLEWRSHVNDTAGHLTEAMAFWLAPDLQNQDIASESLRRTAYAYGMTGLLRTIPYQVQNRDIQLPLALMSDFDLSPEAFYREGDENKKNALYKAVADMAWTDLKAARKSYASHRPEIAKSVLPALLQGRLAQGYLKKLKRVDYDPFKLLIPAKAPWRILTVSWGSLVGRF